MKKRCIMIFPKFSNMEIIDAIRQKYDPLANHVAPHITLVFPFESDLDTESLQKHLQEVCKEFKKFKLELGEIGRGEGYGYYLFLNVIEGKEMIVNLHNMLYGGVLKAYYPIWLNGNYTPHMTIGNFGSEEELEMALKETKNIDVKFTTIVECVSVEIIDENEDSIIEIEHSLI